MVYCKHWSGKARTVPEVRSIKGVHYIWDNYFGRHLDFRIRLFNVLAIAGIIISVIVGVSGLFLHTSAINMAACVFSATAAIVLLHYTKRSGRYQLGYMITIILIFFILFPVFFFTSGGYRSGMPSFFVFAVLFTVFMLDGKRVFIMAAAELILYVAVCVIAKLRPETVHWLPSDTEVLLDTIIGFVTVSAALSLCMFVHFRIYNQQQRELVTAREEAIRLGEVKNTFLANMSHEIRTPINVMLGMTDMVLRDSRDETVSDYARKIQNAGNMLLVLVSNILDLSKIESGKLETREDCYRTAKLLQELYEFGSESARKRELAFNVRADGGLPAELYGDMPRIKQIVTNFISNACKYTNDGSVTLTFRELSRSGTRTVLYISVEDTGIGIAPESLPAVFNPFTRIDLPHYQNIEGTGLGLAIARELTERMNGRIFAESKHGEGSAFWVEIPQEIIDARPMGDWKLYAEDVDDVPAESFTAPDARILVVDDNLENLQTIQALLRRTLMRVDIAESGEDCLAAVRETDYHIILMDYMMPDMDGIDTLRRLREIPGFSAPVIALTANAVAGTEERLLAEGFSAYITKPVRVWELEAAMASKLALTSALVTKRTIRPDDWVTPELKEALTRDLASGGVSLEEGLRHSGGDLPLLARMAEVFALGYPDSLAMVEHAAGDLSSGFEALRHLAHSVKSAAGYVGAADLSLHAELIERRCGAKDGQMISLALPLLYLEWRRASTVLSGFAAHVLAIEPKDKEDTDTQPFDPKRLARYIELRVRRKALLELKRLIAETGGDCPAYLSDARTALLDLDFDTAKQLLADNNVWEG